MPLPAEATHEIVDHTLHQVHSVDRGRNIHTHIYLSVQLTYLSFVLLPTFPSYQHPYCFVIGANFANKRLIPVGAGKATSSSVSSPVPVTLTIVPVPHLL